MRSVPGDRAAASSQEALILKAELGQLELLVGMMEHHGIGDRIYSFPGGGTPPCWRRKHRHPISEYSLPCCLD